jgi:hypothetical protein
MIAGRCERGAAVMLTKITKRAVDSVTRGGANQFLWDRDLKGFGLKVTPAGNKVYILQYRKGGRGAPTKRITIGVATLRSLRNTSASECSPPTSLAA